MSCHALFIQADPVDALVADTCGHDPTLTQALHAYQHTPRVLVWREPSRDWAMLVLILPITARWPRLTDPIFGPLVRDWGLGVRFLGIDAAQSLYDFRALLTAPTLRRVFASLQGWFERQPASGTTAPDPTETLDVLFAALAQHRLTRRETADPTEGRHLARALRLEPEVHDTVFDRPSRYPELTRRLHEALRSHALSVELYCRLLRAIDRREHQAEQHAAALVRDALNPTVLTLLQRTRSGLHLGCYNWLHASPVHARQRAYVLGRLPALAPCFAETLLEAAPRSQHGLMASAAAQSGMSRHDSAHRDALRQAIDSGQDRVVITALAQYFKVQEPVIRRLWRHCPPGLGMPPIWHLQPILRQLDQLPERTWPHDDASWQALAGRTLPAPVH